MEIPFGYDVKLEVIEEILSKVSTEIKKNKDVKSVELLGINDFGDSYLKYAFVLQLNPCWKPYHLLQHLPL